MPDDPMLALFEYKGLPPQMQQVAAPFYELARRLVHTLPQNIERLVALDWLLKAKEAACRSEVLGSPAWPEPRAKEVSLLPGDITPAWPEPRR